MSESPHHLLLASAGTGKTYRLTGHFLDLLFRGVEPERILATTFTRKAAGEILDRVLRRLMMAVTDEKERRALGGDRRISAADCTALLAKLTRRLDRFQVRTLDSFFVHLARLFALDLALPPEWSIADEREAALLREETIGRVLAAADVAQRLDLLRSLQKEAASRSVHDALLRVVDEGRSAFLESDATAWERVRPGPGLGEEEVAELIARLTVLPTPKTTSTNTPRKNYQNNLDNARRLVADGGWESFLELTLVQRAGDDEPKFDRIEVPEDIVATLRPLADHAAHVLIARLARQNAATRTFLDRFEAAWRELQHERGALRFEDLPSALAPSAVGGTRPLDERELDMWFRLDGRIDHLLLDEFQDTAPMQWRVLEPLVDEVLADGLGERSLFCVGDVKQSIYGWRQAEPRLLEGLARRPELSPETMVKSYRSAATVLDAVNLVFTRIDENHVLADDERTTQRLAAAHWCGGFAAHEAAKDLPGAVVLHEAGPADEGEERDAPALALAVERVAALTAEAPTATIGILLRRKVRIPRLIYLLRDAGIRASGEGGNPLTDSAAVLVLLSLLQLADHPADSAAAFHVATSPLGPALGLGFDADGAVSTAQAQALARSVRARLVREGYGPFCASVFAMGCADERWSAWDRRRFAKLVELAHAFDENAGLRPAEFADHVRLTKVEDPAAAQVRVMTIHAAKGLEFDAVVLPELNQEIGRHRDEILTSRPDPFGLIESASHNPKKAVVRLNDELSALSAEATRRDFTESLSVLYVAMTRAARRLEMIVQEGSSRALTYAALLRAALANAAEPPPGILWQSRSVEDWGIGLDAPGTVAPPTAPPSLVLAPSTNVRALPSRSPSAEEGGGAPSAADLLRPAARKATARGSLVHRWLEELGWIEDFTATDEELLALAAPLEPDPARRRTALRELRDALALPAVRDALARPAGEGFEVFAEYGFSVILPDDDGAASPPTESLWTGAIDRLILQRRNGQVVAAEVLDYKSDRIDDSALEERTAFYRPQLEGYRRVVAALTGLAPTAITTRLVFLAPGRVVDL